MQENTFRMHFPKSGLLRYVLLSIIPSACYVLIVYIMLSLGILQWGSFPGYSCFDGAGWLFIFLFAYLVVPRNHNIDVQCNTLIERDHKGLHIRTVQACQIDHFRVNLLNEIILLDIHNRKLLCVEKDMTNFDRFEEWLRENHIESK